MQDNESSKKPKFLKSKKDAFMLKKSVQYLFCYTLKQAKQNATYNPTLFFSCF